MTETDTDTENLTETVRRKRGNEKLKPITDRLTREPQEHPDPIPPQNKPHPVNASAGATRRRHGPN